MPRFDREERAPSLVLAQRRPGQTSFASAYFEHRLDYFWQHHLGNYLKYMNQQYGG